MKQIVSVVIPVAKDFENVIKTITENLDDAVEWIVIDDAFLKQGQKSELKRYNVRIITNAARLGAGYSRNNGIAVAKGEYIYFCDSDDEFVGCGTLRCLYNLADEKCADMVGGNIVLKRKGAIVDNNTFNPKFNIPREGFVPVDEFQSDYGFTRFLYRRDFLERHNIRFPNLRQYEDPVFLLDCFFNKPKVYYCNCTSYIINDYGSKRWTENRVVDLEKGIYNNIISAFQKGFSEIARDNIRRVFADFGNIWFINNDDNYNYKILNIIKEKCILQYLQLPSIYDSAYYYQYFSYHDSEYIKIDAKFELKKGGRLCFSTYLNAFSCTHWKLYSDVNSVSLVLLLRGKGELTLYQELFTQDTFTKRVDIARHIIDAPTKRYVHFDYQDIPDEGIIAFELKANEVIELWEGFYLNNYYTEHSISIKDIWSSAVQDKNYKVLRTEIANYEQDIKDANYIINEIQKSLSYKIGLAITFIPRKILEFFKKNIGLIISN